MVKNVGPNFYACVHAVYRSEVNAKLQQGIIYLLQTLMSVRMGVTAAPMHATTLREDSPVPAPPGLVCWQTGKPVRVSGVNSPC